MNRFDLLLLVLGAAGLALFLALIPRQHPDAGAAYGIGEEAAIERARGFLEANGYPTAGRTPAARLVRDRALLDSLQDDVGRGRLVEALRAGAREHLPPYHWDVRWRSDSGEPELAVRLTPGGRVWAFSHPGAARVTARSTDARLPWTEPLDAAALARGEAAELVAAAERALEATVFAEVRAVPVRLEPLAGGEAARLRVEAPEPVLGRTVFAHVDIAASGQLLALEPLGREELPVQNAATIELGDAFGVARFVAVVLLALSLLVLVLRRASARVLDSRTALKDALLGGALTAAGVLLAVPVFVFEMSFWQAVLIALVGALFGAAGVGLAVFVASAAASTLARERGEASVRTLDLVRQADWLNVPVGQALLRGAALGGFLLGLATALLLPPWARLEPSGELGALTAQLTFSLYLTALLGSAWGGLLFAQGVLVAPAAWLRGRRPRLIAPVLTVLAGLLLVGAVDLPTGPAALRWTAHLLAGAIVTMVFLRTDALAVTTGLVVAGTLWGTVEGWVVPDSPARLDAALALGTIAAVTGIGVAGLRSGRTGEALPVYEPDFVREQRERARLQRELEIAREVQRSFLPSRFPDVAGVDLAARCVPAEAVGGDYYDVVRVGSRRLGIVVGDVSGKGIQAAFFMTFVKGLVLSLADDTARPASVLDRLNARFAAHAPRGIFVSLVYGVLDLEARTFTFCRAGHPPLLLRRAAGTVHTLRPDGLAVGLTADGAFGRTLRECTVRLEPGDTLVLYTDGVLETMGPGRRLYGEERLLAAVATAPPEPDALLEAVLADVRAHAGPTGLDDDLTLLALRLT